MFKIFFLKNRIIILIIFILFFIYFFSLPKEILKNPNSTLIEDKNGNLLGAKISDDGQWRFPHNKEINKKFENCILEFEDAYFYYHFGVNPVSLFRAFFQNIKANKIVSGASTIPMQVIRMHRRKERTISEKIIEIIMAIFLELSYSKKEILAIYSSNAPFGGNVVGLDAASWRYFGRSQKQLSWAENALLAVLPNAPSLIHLGKNRNKLLQKRNKLLEKLQKNGIIDSTTLILSKAEKIPEKPFSLPQIAPHLLTEIYKKHKGERIKTTLDINLQKNVNNIVEKYKNIFSHNEIFNIAVLVLDVESGNILSYVGNTKDNKKRHNNDVNIINSPRSTGSILKPFLFAASLEDGLFLENSLIKDIPTNYAGYSPKNFYKNFDGMVPASESLSRSLNVPAVRMLKNYGFERFYDLMKKLKMSTLNYPASHYGLSLILGGAEGKLEEITGIYADFARILNHYTKYNGVYFKDDFKKPNFFYKKNGKNLKKNFFDIKNKEENSIIGAASIYLTFKSLLEVNRPSSESSWKIYNSYRKIAWKTGTSYGFRDAWAVGTTAKFTVGIWVGNADGEGRPNLTGISYASPILFDVFKLLPKSNWFSIPYDDMKEIEICRKSGYKASEICDVKDKTFIQKSGLKTPLCPYHKLLHLDSTEQFRVNSECENINKIVHKSYFILPTVCEWFYKKKNPFYKSLPPFRKDCSGILENKSMEIIYPKKLNNVYIPVDLDGKKSEIVFSIAHKNENIKIFWHLDEKFIGTTQYIHQFGINAKKGNHILTLVDENGETLKKKININY
ncbi:MAG: penicillin-binding protein 1C [Bacteroidetes bacterium 4572_128]|nr:MAG: penicillin-binding protein 1C [Bacteroidetes bacterium 4572_128]